MPSAARSLAEDLRLRSDDDLLRLFALRPLLLRPVPKSFADLALRANSAPATIAALDDLTAAELDVLTACCALAVAGRFTAADVAEGLDVDVDRVAPILDSLYSRVLLWGAREDLRVPSAVREAVGREPCGLDATVRRDLPAVRAALAEPERLRAEVGAAPAATREAVMRAAWETPTVIPTSSQDAAAVDWLADRSLLARNEAGQQVLPREIALILRHGALIAEPALRPPGAAAHRPANPAVDARAGHEADQALRDLDRTMAELGQRPWTRLGNGAVSVRDWDRTRAVVGISPDRMALLVLLAWTLDWIAPDEDLRLRPSTAYLTSLAADRASRWATLVTAWLGLRVALPREPERVLAVREDPVVVTARRMVLTCLTESSGEDIGEWLAWYRPRMRPAPRLVSALLAEAEALGLTVGRVPAAVLRNLTWPPTVATLRDAVEPLLPAVTDRVVLQADLTATALGPLDPATERRLARVSLWESGGGATVFRFSPETVRMGLAAGEDPGDLLEWLGRVSATPVPQALEVLVADQAAALPRMSVRPARAVIECDPDAAQDLVADPRLTDLQLRIVAPGVVTAATAADVLADRLRASGHAVLDTPLAAAPTPPDRPGRVGPEPQTPLPQRVIRSLHSIERRDHPESHPPHDLGMAPPHAIVRDLADAADRHRRIWLAFADDSGTRMTHLVEPLAVAAGDVCAFDLTAAEIRTIPLERVVGLAPLQR